MAYVQRANESIVDDIDATSDEHRARRLSIYYNAYRIRLRGSIEVDHPALGVYLGDDGFETLAAAYIDTHPSDQTSLRHFCDHLPDFLRHNKPFSDFGVLSQLAEFERLLMDVFDAADSDAQPMDNLTSIPATQWPSIKLLFHPSVRLYVSSWNSVEIWRAIKANQKPPEALQSENQAWLVWRNFDRLTEFRSLAADEYAALSNALDGVAFAGICESQLEWSAETIVAQNVLDMLRMWFTAGIVISIDI